MAQFITSPKLQNDTSSPETINQNIIGAQRTAVYDDSGAALVIFDAVISEGHSFKTKISNHPSEDGVQFSDQQTREPVIVTLSIVKSNNPLNSFTLSTDAIPYLTQLGAGLAGGTLDSVKVPGTKVEVKGAAVGTAIASLTSFIAGVVDGNPREDKKAFDALRKSQIDSTRMILVTPFQTYPNMFLKDIDVTKNNKTTEALVATLVFQEVLIYHTQETTIEAKGTTQEVVDKQKAKKKKGSKKADDASAAQAAKAQNVSPGVAAGQFLGLLD